MWPIRRRGAKQQGLPPPHPPHPPPEARTAAEIRSTRPAAPRPRTQSILPSPAAVEARHALQALQDELDLAHKASHGPAGRGMGWGGGWARELATGAGQAREAPGCGQAPPAAPRAAHAAPSTPSKLQRRQSQPHSAQSGSPLWTASRSHLRSSCSVWEANATSRMLTHRAWQLRRLAIGMSLRCGEITRCTPEPESPPVLPSAARCNWDSRKSRQHGALHQQAPGMAARQSGPRSGQGVAPRSSPAPGACRASDKERDSQLPVGKLCILLRHWQAPRTRCALLPEDTCETSRALRPTAPAPSAFEGPVYAVKLWQIYDSHSRQLSGC